MAAGWKRFTGESQYPELTSNKDHTAFTYGTKTNRGFKLPWLQGKRDLAEEREILRWVSAASGEPAPSDYNDVIDWLASGEPLCRLLARYAPKTLRSPINEKKSMFAASENIHNFLEALKILGIPEADVFSRADLCEKRDLGGLVHTLQVLRQRLGQ